MSENNPYLAPAANLDAKSTDHQSMDKIKQFPRFSTWAVFGLAMITFGFYTYYWFFSRTTILNRLLPDKPIASWIPILTIVLVIFNQVLSLMPFLISMDMLAIEPDVFRTILLISQFIGIITLVFFLIWVFGIRNRINILSGSNKGSSFWLGGILTFFLNVLYFQYKINQMHDNG